ncbi:hypothetical protein [Caulobacter hibisci]|uniref:Uncharacterized protein n=1 Tax=Caulobacter hibisci TaxID=2035993 RepID=A0ABS0T3V9_9CAUL|nr:hypothetical protein [Caulobacter hibisci]MBI1686570.1 hypothetical protein [Caulobacter hibisci]
MTAAVHDRAAHKSASKIAWTRLSGKGLAGQALGLVLSVGMVASGALFVILSF